MSALAHRYTLWLCLLLGLLALPAAAEEDPRQDLEQLNLRIEQRRHEISGILKKESSVLKNLRQVEEGLLHARSETEQLKAREAVLAKGKRASAAKLSDLRKHGERIKDSLARGLRLLYQKGNAGYLGYLLRAATLEDLLARDYLLRHVLRANHAALTDIQKNIAAVEQEQQRAENNLALLSQVQGELTRSRDRYRMERQRKEILLRLVHEQKDFHQRSIREMEAASANLHDLVRKLDDPENKERPKIPFASRKGLYAPPVKGGRLGRRFGERFDPKMQATVRFKGLEFIVDEGTAVTALAAGRVVFAGWFEGYGQLIIVDHGEGYFTLYGNFSSLQKKINDTVKAGESIGLSGSTGSLSGPRLYFEIRQRGVAKDPREWLRLP